MANDHNDADEAIGAKVLFGAMLTGAKDGVTESLASKAEETGKKIASLIEPGDQRHVPHPLDQFKSRMLWAAEWIIAPGDMNLKHSPHPVDTTAKIHDALINAAADTLTEKGLVEGVRTTSAVAAAIAVDNTDPFKKLQMVGKINDLAVTEETLTKKPIVSWNDYAHLLGKGSQPPKLKPLRDFSGLMDYQAPMPWAEYSRLSYTPAENHKIIMDMTHYYEWSEVTNPVIKSTKMEFVVVAEGDRSLHGSGAEMFHSAMKLLKVRGIDVNQIDANWGHGSLSTNYDAFAKSFADGSSVKEAISKTPTGRYVADRGFTEVGGRHFEQTINGGNLSGNLHPEFKKPVLSDEKSYNDYGNAWASSQGRASQDLVHRQKPIESSAKLPTTELPLSGLTKTQADAVRQYMHEHIDKHFDALISGQKINPEMK